MNKSILKKTLTFVVSLMLLLQSFIVFPSSAVENDHNTLIELEKRVSKRTLTVGDEFTIDYTIRPKSITPENNEYKEIALVIDTSLKMNKTFHGRHTRLNIAKDAAINFIDSLTLDENDKFIGNSKVKISLISFRNKAFVEKYSVKKSFVDLSNEQRVEKLKKSINNLKVTGNDKNYGSEKNPGKSNIGDGLREAYYALKNNSDRNSEKSLVLLTYGEASAYSFRKYKHYSYYYLGEKLGYQTGYNINYSKEYAEIVARKKLSDKSMKLKTTIVDLGKGANEDFLKSITDIVDGEYVKAIDENFLDGIYNSTYPLQNNLRIKDMIFKETFPEGLEIEEVNIVEGTADVYRDGQNISLDIGDKEYTLNNQGKLEAETTKFTVKLRATNLGNYKLKDKLTYYLDEDRVISSMPEINLKVAKSTSNVKAPIYVYNSTDENKYSVDEEILINYLINPENIPVEYIVSDDYFRQKEIVLVLDLSASMNYSLNGHSRIDIAKSAANAFVDKFKDDDRVSIGLVTYGSYSKINKIDNDYFANVLSEGQLDKIHGVINGLKPFSSNDNRKRGGTNIGDGLRNAYWMLNKSGNPDAKKYVLLMTDGQPTALTYDDVIYSNNSSDYIKGYKITQSDAYPVKGYVESFKYKKDDGDFSKVFVNYGSDDLKDFSLKYSCEIGDMISESDLDINSFIIGFSNGANKEKLQNIAAHADGFYKEALSAEDIDEVYDQLADQIQSNLSIHGISYYEEFPNEIEIIDVSEKLAKIDDHTVNSNDVGKILYSLNESKTEYIADPIEFWVKVKANMAGNYKLAVDDDDNNIAYIKYSDIDGLETTKIFDQLVLSIYEEIPPDIVATLIQGQSSGDDYILKIKIDEPARLKVMNLKDGVLNYIIDEDYTDEDLKEYPKEFTWNIPSDELLEENLFNRFSLNIEAEDIYGNISTETIGFSDISFTMKDFDHEKSGLVNQRLVTLNISSETGAWIKEIIVNGKLVIEGRPTNEGAYSKPNVLVNDGINYFSVKIINRDQNGTIQHFEEQIDARPPEINAEYTEENSKINVVFPDEEGTVTWIEVDINGDGEITDSSLDANNNPTVDEIFDLSEIELSTVESDREYEISMKPEWYNKKIIVKGKDTSGNIGSGELSDLPKIEIVKQGIFIENDYENIEDYLVTNGEKQIKAVNKFENNIGTLLRVIDKANISNPEVTIQLNITNEQDIHSQISELKLYKFTENKIDKDHMISIDTLEISGNKIKFILPISGENIAEYYILVYKYECDASDNSTYQFSKTDGNKLLLTNKLELLNTSDDLKIIIEDAPNIL